MVAQRDPKRQSDFSMEFLSIPGVKKFMIDDEIIILVGLSICGYGSFAQSSIGWE